MQKDAVRLDSSLSLVGLGRGAQEGCTGGAEAWSAWEGARAGGAGRLEVA